MNCGSCEMFRFRPISIVARQLSEQLAALLGLWTRKNMELCNVLNTYPLIVLIKLDFPVPELPMIAISTCTSFHPSILLLQNFAMESGLQRPFFSNSSWKSCTYFNSQFIAIGRLEIVGYKGCCESGPQQPEQRQSVTKLKSTVVTKHSRSQCLRVLSLQSHPEEEFCKYLKCELSKPLRRIEVTKVRACCVG